jgi:hypothetical protein
MGISHLNNKEKKIKRDVYMGKSGSEEIREKGFKLFSGGRVKKDIDTDRRTHFSVQGETEKHSVIMDKERKEWSCDCRYFALTQKDCSHIFAAKLSVGKSD